MAQEQRRNDTAVRKGAIRTIVARRSVRRVCGSLVGLGILGTSVLAARGLAQDENPFHLTVRPREMATGTRTERAGVIPLYPKDSLAQEEQSVEGELYVPQQCVGARRCPLLVYFDAGGRECCIPWYAKSKPNLWEWLGPPAEKYGIIMFNAGSGLDAALTEILQKFAIDPERIAIVGRCATGQIPMNWGDANPEVFNRMATFTANDGDPSPRQPNQRSEYLLANEFPVVNFMGAKKLRARGYTVKSQVAFRGHDWLEEDYDFLGHWLMESWAIPDPAARPVPYTFTAPPPLLTTEAVAKMTAFWTRFTAKSDSMLQANLKAASMLKADSVRQAASTPDNEDEAGGGFVGSDPALAQRELDSMLVHIRRAYVREAIMPVADEPVSVLMVDMAALAAAQPSVAAMLKAAGLTAEEHDAYRFALASALFAKQGLAIWKNPFQLDTTSALAKNIAFLAAHPDELQALENTKIWKTP